jgi:mannose-6-phosphate isomerase-like protein (cupin superfamily)
LNRDLHREQLRTGFAHRAGDTRLVELEHVPHSDETVSGRIIVADFAQALPFAPRRLYWIHGMAMGERRGFHAHRRLWQAMVAIAGEIEIELDDAESKVSHRLSDCGHCLIVPPGLWREIRSVSAGAALLVIASESYDEADYIRDYQQFLAYRRSRTSGA